MQPFCSVSTLRVGVEIFYVVSAIPRLGDVTMFDPDYIDGLRKMMEQSDPRTWLGWYDNFQEDVLIVQKPEHVLLKVVIVAQPRTGV